METNLRVALKMIHRLGYLRGAAAKIGQMLGSLPEILPEQVVQTLDRLHCEAPPMHFSLLRAMVRNELGHDPEDLFESFEKEAFAAASIGQVHRAQLKSGERVVIKIQYPAIAKTIDSDLRSIRALLFPARLGKDWDYTKAHFDEIHRMLRMEVDYEQEAANLRRAQELFAPQDGTVVPRIFDEYSTARVLTMEHLPGLHLRAFLATRPSQQERNEFGTKIYTAWARLHNAGMNYADPHSGNYLFMNDGRLGLIDFGCVQHYSKEEGEILRHAERLMEEPELLPSFLRRCGVPSTQLRNAEFMALMQENCAWAYEPLLTSPFNFADETHFKRGVEIVSRIVRKRYTRNHPMWLYFNRSLFGVRALMYQLHAQVDVAAIFDQEGKARVASASDSRSEQAR